MVQVSEALSYRTSTPLESFKHLANAVVQTLDNTIQGKITIQWISVSETNCVIQWIVIYPVDNTIHHLRNWVLTFILGELIISDIVSKAIILSFLLSVQLRINLDSFR